MFLLKLLKHFYTLNSDYQRKTCNNNVINSPATLWPKQCNATWWYTVYILRKWHFPKLGPNKNRHLSDRSNKTFSSWGLFIHPYGQHYKSQREMYNDNKFSTLFTFWLLFLSFLCLLKPNFYMKQALFLPYIFSFQIVL